MMILSKQSLKLAFVSAISLVFLAPATQAISTTFSSSSVMLQEQANTNSQTLIAAGVKKRIQFPRGESSTKLSGAVVRGDRDVYTLGAKADQTMNLSISSTEANAVFKLVDPNGNTLAEDVTTWSDTLPLSGDYQVYVGGTRGNASYTLQVSIN